MLKSMRDSASSPFIKMLLIVLVLSFISFYGFNKVRGGCQSDVVAEVNGDTIGLSEFISAFKNSYEMYRKFGLLKGGEDKEIMNRLKTMVLESLIESKIKLAEAKKLGLKVSDTELAAQIKGQFTDPSNGEFNAKYYEMVLRQYGMTAERYEELQRERMLTAKLDEFIKSTVKISEDEVLSDYKAKNESIDLLYVKFDPENFVAKVKTPDEKSIKDFYEKNKTNFKTDEERRIEYLYLNPADFIKIGDTELEKYYNDKIVSANQDEYKGLRVRASHILIQTGKGEDDKALAKRVSGIENKLKGGESFEKLAAIYNPDATKFTGGDLGYFSKGKMVKEFENTAFDLKTGQTSKPIKTSFGYHFVRVTDRIEPGEVTLGRLKNEVTYDYLRDILNDPAKFKPYEESMTAVLNPIREAIIKEPGKTLKDLAASYKGQGKIVAGETGFFNSKGSIDGIADSMQMISEAYKLLPNEASNIFYGSFSKFAYLIRLKEKKDAAIPSLESIRGQVSLAYREEQAASLAKDAGENFLKSVERNPAGFEAIARSAKYVTVATGPFKRTPSALIPVLGNSLEIMDKGFMLNKSDPIIKSVVGLNGQFYVVKLKDRMDADISKFESQKKDLLRIALEERQKEYVEDWMSLLRNSAKIKRFELKELDF